MFGIYKGTSTYFKILLNGESLPLSPGNYLTGNANLAKGYDYFSFTSKLDRAAASCGKGACFQDPVYMGSFTVCCILPFTHFK